MSDPRFTQPWHGVPREQISWSPAIEPEHVPMLGDSPSDAPVTGTGQEIALT